MKRVNYILNLKESKFYECPTCHAYVDMKFHMVDGWVCYKKIIDDMREYSEKEGLMIGVGWSP